MTYPAPVKYVLIGKESAWGTAVSATKDCGLVIDTVETPAEREVMGSKGMSSPADQFITAGIATQGMSLSGEYQHGRLLEGIFGSVSDGNNGSDYLHTFTIGTTSPSYTIETGNNLAVDTTLAANGQLVERAELSIALNEKLKLGLEFKGKKAVIGSTAAAAILSTLPVYPHALVTVSLNSIAATECQNAKITVTKTVSRSGGISSNDYQQGHATTIEFDYSATLGFETKIFHDLFWNGTIHEFDITASNGIAYGSGKRGVQWTLWSCNASSMNERASVGNLTFIDVSGKGILKQAYSWDNITAY
jgi:hypothetical protein